MRSAPNDNANILVLYSEKVKSLAAKQRFLEKKRQGRPSKRPPLPCCGCFFCKVLLFRGDAPALRLLADPHKAAVETFLLYQLGVGALLDDLTVFDHKDLIGVADGF